LGRLPWSYFWHLGIACSYLTCEWARWKTWLCWMKKNNRNIGYVLRVIIGYNNCAWCTNTIQNVVRWYVSTVRACDCRQCHEIWLIEAVILHHLWSLKAWHYLQLEVHRLKLWRYAMRSQFGWSCDIIHYLGHINWSCDIIMLWTLELVTSHGVTSTVAWWLWLSPRKVLTFCLGSRTPFTSWSCGIVITGCVVSFYHSNRANSTSPPLWYCNWVQFIKMSMKRQTEKHRSCSP
jgi:hypothetical protein